MEIEQINNDVYGNPRYIIHWLYLVGNQSNINCYAHAEHIARKLGFTKYRSKKRTYYFVVTTYESKEQLRQRIENEVQ